MVVFTRSRSGKLACRTGTRQAGRRAGGRLISFNVTALELAHVSGPVGAGRLVWMPQSVWNLHGVNFRELPISAYKHLSCAAFKIKLTTGSGNAGTCEKLHDRSRCVCKRSNSLHFTSLHLPSKQNHFTYITFITFTGLPPQRANLVIVSPIFCLEGDRFEVVSYHRMFWGFLTLSQSLLAVGGPVSSVRATYSLQFIVCRSSYHSMLRDLVFYLYLPLVVFILYFLLFFFAHYTFASHMWHVYPLRIFICVY